jgi:hypothetical protein
VKPTGWFEEIAMQSLGPAAAKLSRRELFRRAALGAGTLGAAERLAGRTSKSSPSGKAQSGSVRALTANLPQLSILSAQTQIPVERSRFAFGLAAENNRLVEGVQPKVWFGRDQNHQALGPFQAEWLELGAYDKTRDRSPRSELKGYYVADVDLPEQPGNWLAVAIIEVASQRTAAQGTVPVAAKVPAPVGTKAISGATPVATSARQAAHICTRTPVCPLHEISLDKALKSGKPTVLSISTPLLCTSRMCGPVLDEVMVTAQRVADKANFIHLEIYPERDTNRPAPLYKAWGLKSEPWTVIIGADSYIASRGEGPMVASEIEAALGTVL